jgi:hypothetical protein
MDRWRAVSTVLSESLRFCSAKLVLAPPRFRVYPRFVSRAAPKGQDRLVSGRALFHFWG